MKGTNKVKIEEKLVVTKPYVGGICAENNWNRSLSRFMSTECVNHHQSVQCLVTDGTVSHLFQTQVSTSEDTL